jgi:FMN-dependent NADH-azoreductase
LPFLRRQLEFPRSIQEIHTKESFMASLLHILASPRPESYSTRLANAFLETYRKASPQDRVETLDLFKAEIPPFAAPQAKGKYAVMSGQAPRDDGEAAWKTVIETINYFKRFDKYVLSCPMWNFAIPYRLKQYIDIIVQPGLTFTFSPDKGYSGLMSGRPVQLLLARGGSYQQGNPLETYDFQEPYLRTILGFIGITDVRAVTIQGTGQDKTEKFAADFRAAIAAAQEAAPEFAGNVALTV